MSALSSNWLVLQCLNRSFTIFGLFFPIHPNTMKNTRIFGKITAIVLFFVSSLLLFSLNGFYQNTARLCYVIITCVETACCITILSLRIIRYSDVETLFKVILVSAPVLKSFTRQDAKELILRNRDLICAVMVLLILNSSNIFILYYTYGMCFVYHILEVLMYTLLTVENLMVFYLLKIMLLWVRELSGSLTNLYSEFYKVPPAELKKVDNGDFILVGWISQALNSRKDKEVLPLVTNIACILLQLKTAIEVFNNTLGTSLFCIILSTTVRSVCVSSVYLFGGKEEEKYLIYISTAKLCLSMLYLHGVIKTSGQLTKEIASLGNRSFKLFLNMPSKVFIKEEIEMKELLGFINRFVLNEDWSLMATKMFILNCMVYKKISMLFVLSLQFILLFKNNALFYNSTQSVTILHKIVK